MRHLIAFHRRRAPATGQIAQRLHSDHILRRVHRGSPLAHQELTDSRHYPGAKLAESQHAIAKADRVYAGHMGSDLEEHGIWGTPQGVIDRIGAHVEKGCGHFVIEFFGRDVREPATLFAEEVMPAFS